VPSDTYSRRQFAAGSGLARTDLWAENNCFIFRDEDSYSFWFDTALLDPSSTRLSIRGNDPISPRHIVVWGMTTLPLADYPDTPAVVRTPVPLGMALHVNKRLSGQFHEGPRSMLISRVAPWSPANQASGERVVDQVILTIGLGSDPNAGTQSPVRFRILRTETVVCSHVLEGFSSLRSNEWKTWLIPVISPFSWSDIMSVPRALQPC
jgi:hypothetical protein